MSGSTVRDCQGDVRSVLFGIAVGDALGVPVEFLSREQLRLKPVTDMIGFGTHHQPPGTWSDDSSLTFCLAETLSTVLDLQEIAGSFVRWYGEGWWTPHGEVFDIGITTARAIEHLRQGVPPDRAAERGESSNGNGSLMRIAPLVFVLEGRSAAERFEVTRRVSSLTHGHIRSAIACHIYLEFLQALRETKNPAQAYEDTQTRVLDALSTHPETGHELVHFERVLRRNIAELPESEIRSGGYVVETLEAALWSLIRAESFEETVITAVNLGGDADTTGAVAGGMAGFYYGYEKIPSRWIDLLARKDDIEDLVRRTAERLSKEPALGG